MPSVLCIRIQSQFLNIKRRENLQNQKIRRFKKGNRDRAQNKAPGLSGGGQLNISSEHQLEIILRFSVDHFQIREIPNSSKLSKMNYKLYTEECSVLDIITISPHLKVFQYISVVILNRTMKRPESIKCFISMFTCYLKQNKLFHQLSKFIDFKF